MAKEIIWSPRADKNFDRIIEYLKKDWTEKEVIKFVKKTYQILEKLKKGNITFRSSKKKNISGTNYQTQSFNLFYKS